MQAAAAHARAYSFTGSLPLRKNRLCVSSPAFSVCFQASSAVRKSSTAVFRLYAAYAGSSSLSICAPIASATAAANPVCGSMAASLVRSSSVPIMPSVQTDSEEYWERYPSGNRVLRT